MIQSIDPAACTGCGTCTKTCPLDVFRLVTQQEEISPCMAACPAGVDIRRNNSLIQQGRLDEAAENFLNYNPFPGITGRVCFHPCKSKCSRAKVDEAVNKYSQGALEHVTLYSIMEDPMTSCGCFECICGIEPFSNGVIIVNREHAGMTPLGMTFSEMASMTGGGVQTPGFMGHGKHFISSKKFMKAEGGIERIVWMPKALKEQVADRVNATAKELYGIDNFTDMIGDETIAEDPETLLEFLTEKGHPALGMEPMM